MSGAEFSEAVASQCAQYGIRPDEVVLQVLRAQITECIHHIGTSMDLTCDPSDRPPGEAQCSLNITLKGYPIFDDALSDQLWVILRQALDFIVGIDSMSCVITVFTTMRIAAQPPLLDGAVPGDIAGPTDDVTLDSRAKGVLCQLVNLGPKGSASIRYNLQAEAIAPPHIDLEAMVQQHISSSPLPSAKASKSTSSKASPDELFLSQLYLQVFGEPSHRYLSPPHLSPSASSPVTVLVLLAPSSDPRMTPQHPLSTVQMDSILCQLSVGPHQTVAGGFCTSFDGNDAVNDQEFIYFALGGGVFIHTPGHASRMDMTCFLGGGLPGIITVSYVSPRVHVSAIILPPFPSSSSSNTLVTFLQDFTFPVSSCFVGVIGVWSIRCIERDPSSLLHSSGESHLMCAHLPFNPPTDPLTNEVDGAFATVNFRPNFVGTFGNGEVAIVSSAARGAGMKHHIQRITQQSSGLIFWVDQLSWSLS